MKKFLLYFAWFPIIFSAAAQPDMQISIQTDKGILTVSKTTGGRDVIIISIGCWDEMAAGTQYKAAGLSFLKEKKLCMEIADKKAGGCNTGIGFGCSMYNCPGFTESHVVNNANRICSVAVRKIKGAVKIIFNDEMDWESLQGINR